MHIAIDIGGAWGWRKTPVCDRGALPRQAFIEGPAIVIQPDTTVIYPGYRAGADASGNLVMNREMASA